MACVCVAGRAMFQRVSGIVLYMYDSTGGVFLGRGGRSLNLQEIFVEICNDYVQYALPRGFITCVFDRPSVFKNVSY